MSKSKLIWSFAFILISIISLPIAYAQAFTGSRIFFILVNAAIIGIVLFILQAFLIPGKPDKEKVSAWVIILIASLLISWFYGTNGYIWEVGPLALIFNPVVIINTVIIGIVLYLLSGFLDLKKKAEHFRRPSWTYNYHIFDIINNSCENWSKMAMASRYCNISHGFPLLCRQRRIWRNTKSF